jgi:hypothetical protein
LNLELEKGIVVTAEKREEVKILYEEWFMGQ